MAATFCGLICCPTPKERVPVPLESVSVHADIRGWTAAVTAELSYRNKMAETIECQFVFPLTDTSAVYRLEADIAGKKLIAECRPRKEAEETYRDAVDSGQAGVLLENQAGSPDVFRIMLGNLPPNQEAKVTIGFVQPVERDAEGGLTLVLPSVLNPRYVPRHMVLDPEKMKDQFHFKVPYVSVSDISYSMTFSAKIDLGIDSPIVDVKSTHDADKVTVTFEGDKKQVATVNLDGKFVQDHDFGLRITPGEPFKPMVFIQPGQASGANKNWLSYDVAAAWFEPETAKDKTPGLGIPGDEYWLVIDRSGSMEGDKIRDAKTALVLFVKSLPVGCKFNIIGFGSTFVSLFPDGSVNYSDETITKAVQHSNELDADLGGTEILEPLQFIYKQPKPTAAGARQFIVILTDGEVGNTDEVIELARKNSQTSRVFAIGIGEGASTALVNGMARASGGVSEFVRSASDRLQAKIISLLKAATNPAAENIKIDWEISGGKIVSYLPDSIPSAAYQGRPVMQYAIIERSQGNNVDGSAKLTALIGDKPTEHKLAFNIASSLSTASGDPMPLHRLAAKARIQEMTDKLYKVEDQEAWKKDMVAISVATGVLCEETAFVAVDPETRDQVKDEKGKPTFVDIERPTSYRWGYGGGRMMHCRAMPKMACCMVGMGAPPPMMAMAMMPPPGAGAPPPMFDAMLESSAPMPMAQLEPDNGPDLIDFSPKKKEDVGDAMDKLVRLQNFNGSWSFGKEVVELVAKDRSPDDVRKEAIAATNKSVTDDAAVATLLAVALLRHKFAERRDEWELIEMKAIGFLRGALGPAAAPNIDKFVEAIAKAFSL